MSKKEIPSRASFMKQSHKDALGKLPRTHHNCKAYTGVSRPGKTAKDRWMNSVK